MANAPISGVDPRKLSIEEFVSLLEPANGAMDPQVFAKLIKHASAEQLNAVLDDPQRRSALLGTIFARVGGPVTPGACTESGFCDSLADHWRGQRRGCVRDLDYRRSGFLEATVFHQQGTLA
jgi:hypothetical protein